MGKVLSELGARTALRATALKPWLVAALQAMGLAPAFYGEQIGTALGEAAVGP